MNIQVEINQHFQSYIDDWNYTNYFLVGGYGSSKSYNTGYKLIFKLLQEKRKALVIRNVYETMRDSVFSLLIEIIENLNLSHVIKHTVSPLNIKFPNGSEIIFKGMDKPEKLKSINDITIIWIEEASEIPYAGYKELRGRARHPYLKIHFLITTNPVSKRNWVYRHFFIDKEQKKKTLDDKLLYKHRVVVKNDTYYHHSTVDDNMFMQQSYIDTLDEMAEYDKDLYRVARKGQFGTNGTKVLPRFKVMGHEWIMTQVAGCKFKSQGMDFGYSNSFNAAVKVSIDKEQNLYIYKDYYKKGMTDDMVVEDLDFQAFKHSITMADNADPKTIAYFNANGFSMMGAYKYTNLIQVQRMRRFKNIYCSDECKATIEELEDLTFKQDNNGDIIPDQFTIDPHTFDAIKYAIVNYDMRSLKTISKKDLGL